MQKTNIIGNDNKKLEDIDTICCIYAFKRIKDDSYTEISLKLNRTYKHIYNYINRILKMNGK